MNQANVIDFASYLETTEVKETSKPTQADDLITAIQKLIEDLRQNQLLIPNKSK